VTIYWVPEEGCQDEDEMIDFCVRKDDWDAFLLLVFLQVPEFQDLDKEDVDGIMLQYTWDLGASEWKAFCGSEDLALLISAGRDVFVRVAPMDEFLAPGEEEEDNVRSSPIFHA
jgi:hypothetical protein